MQGFAIVKVEADAVAVQENIVGQFNEFMQRTAASQSFVRDNEGYFRLEYGTGAGVSSAPIEAFGNFLQSAGYSVNGISSAGTCAAEGGNCTRVSFEKNWKEAHVMLSTVRVY